MTEHPRDPNDPRQAFVPTPVATPASLALPMPKPRKLQVGVQRDSVRSDLPPDKPVGPPPKSEALLQTALMIVSCELDRLQKKAVDTKRGGLSEDEISSVKALVNTLSSIMSEERALAKASDVDKLDDEQLLAAARLALAEGEATV